MNNSEITFELKSRSGIAVVITFIALALAANHYRYRYNPRLDELTQSLQSDDPSVIGKALYESGKLTMGKGYKLIPYILPHLSDVRDLPEELKQKIIKEIQSTPGSIPGIKSDLGGIFSIGFTAALTLQGLVIKDVENRRWISGKYRGRIVEYLLDEIGPYSDDFTLKNGLWAVNQIHDKKLVPFWFECLKIESEAIRASALSGLSHYIYDRTHGLFTWHPEKEIDANMIEDLKACSVDNSELVRRSASLVTNALAEAGLDEMRIDN
jgi:hypothetical protein